MEHSPSTAIITGASRGIGFAIARMLGQQGLKLLLVARTPHILRQAQAELAEQGIHCDIFSGDVTSQNDIERLRIEAFEKLKRVDVLVNSAGAAASLPFAKVGLEHWNEMIQANLTSVFLCMQAFLPEMVSRKYGRVVNVASIAGKVGFSYTSAYCAAKHAVLGLTRSVALEVAQKGITVNAVCPGWVDTPMTAETIENIVLKTGRSNEEARGVLERQSPLNRLILPAEVAAVVSFLISPAASAVNGQAINVCGGQVVS